MPWPGTFPATPFQSGFHIRLRLARHGAIAPSPTEAEAVRYKTLTEQLIRHFDGISGVARLIASKTYAS